MSPILIANLDKIIETCKKHYVKKMLVFGSAATNSMTAESDVDFLYEFDTTGLDFNNLKDAPYDYSENFFGLKSELENILKRKVDLIENKPFKNPYFRQSVERSQKMIYGIS